MKKILRFASTICFILVVLSCTKKEQADDNITETCFSDSSEYLLLRYYETGNMAARGFIIDGKMNDIWTEWYADGELRYHVVYNDGRVHYDLKKIKGAYIREDLPVVHFDTDILRAGFKSYIRVVGLYPDETLEYSDNIECKPLVDNSEYDFEITPLSTGEAKFFIQIHTVLSPEETDYPEVAKQMNITEEEARQQLIKMSTKVEIGRKSILSGNL